MQLCDMYSITSTTMVVIVGHGLLLSLWSVLKILNHIFPCPPIAHLCSLFSLDLFEALHVPPVPLGPPFTCWIPPHLPHASNPQLTLLKWASVMPPLCPFVGCGSYYGHCCYICKSVYILKTGTQKKNSEKQKKNLLFQESPPWMFFYLHLLAFLSRRKKGRKILIMANCCSVLQVSVHSQNRRGKKF
jgi:hypothetical protein